MNSFLNENIFSTEAQDVDRVANEMQEEVEEEGHPAAMLLDYLPGEDGDDPLMAIVAQLILLKLEESASIGELPVSLEEIGEELEGRGVHPDEVIEALEWLLEKTEIIEVDEDKFAPN